MGVGFAFHGMCPGCGKDCGQPALGKAEALDGLVASGTTGTRYFRVGDALPADPRLRFEAPLRLTVAALFVHECDYPEACASCRRRPPPTRAEFFAKVTIRDWRVASITEAAVAEWEASAPEVGHAGV